jgi:hypothetical protein
MADLLKTVTDTTVDYSPGSSKYDQINSLTVDKLDNEIVVTIHYKTGDGVSFPSSWSDFCDKLEVGNVIQVV